MGKIMEILTINVAAKDIDATVAKYRALGLRSLPPSHMPEPPAEITDVTIPIGSKGAISVIGATGPGSPVKRFLDKRGEGAFSIAVRVDNLDEVMREWKAAGMEWVLAKPYTFPPGTPAARYVPDRLKVNWVKPATLAGVMLEVFEFEGAVKDYVPE